MSRSATSKRDPVPTPRRSSRRSSLGSPARFSGRLSSLVQQFKATNMDSFTSTPGRSILSDNTDIEQPRRQSWWKKLDNSRDIIEALGNEKVDNANNVLEELDVEILSQEKEQRNFSLDLPDSSGSETIDSIIIPDRKLFTQKENVPQKKFSNMFGPKESLAKLYKPNTEKIKDINTMVGPKKLFSQAPRDRHKIFEKMPTSPIKMSQDDLIVPPKKLFNQENPQRKPIFPDIINTSPKKSGDILEPVAGPKNLFPQNTRERKSIFPSALLETSADKTANKTTEVQKEVQGQVRSLFGNRPTTKRKNMFADFIVVESEDEVPEIQPRIFGFTKKPETKRRDSSPSHALTDAEDDWKMLPSSTMMKHMEGLSSPVKRPKLSTIPKERESEGTHEVHVLTDDDIAADGSGWDSHRTTRKTLRQTFGKDFTPRKSLRALVMEKSAKRQTENPIRESVGHPQANSTEIVQNFNAPQEVVVDTSAHITVVDNNPVNNTDVDNDAVNITDVDNNAVNITAADNTADIENSAMETPDPKTPEIVRNFTEPQEGVVLTSAVDNTRVDKTAVYNTDVNNTAVDNTADIEYSAMETSDPKTPDIVQNLTVPQEEEVVTFADNAAVDNIGGDNMEYAAIEAAIPKTPEILQNLTVPQEVVVKAMKTSDLKTPDIVQNLSVPQGVVVETFAVNNKFVDNTAAMEYSAVESSDPKTPEIVQNSTILEEVLVNNSDVDNTDVNNTDVDNIGSDNSDVNNTDVDNTDVDNSDVDNSDNDKTSVDNTDVDNSDNDKTVVDNSDVDKTGIDTTDVNNTGIDNSNVYNTDVNNTDVDNTGADDTDNAADIEHFEMETSDPKTPEVSIRTRQTTLEIYLEKIRRDVVERKQKSEVAVKNLLTAPKRDMSSFIRASIKRLPRNNIATKPRVSKSKPSAIPLDRIPEEILQDMKYKPPKRFMKNDASWITKRLYKYLETKLEPKYDFKARVKAEKLVERLYHFTKYIQKLEQAPQDSIKELKIIMARLDIVSTHHEFYEFFYEFMPREVRIKVVPNITNKLPMPKHGIFNEIIRAER